MFLPIRIQPTFSHVIIRLFANFSVVSSCFHPLVCAGFATIWPCLIIWNLSLFANCDIALGGGGDHLISWGQVLAFVQGILGGLLPFFQGGWELCSVIFYLFLISLSNGGRVRNWSKLVEHG